jgi:hypothetical protein
MKKVDLQVKTPALHITVKIAEIRIVRNGFIKWFPTLTLCHMAGEGGFSHADISRKTNEWVGCFSSDRHEQKYKKRFISL